MRRILAITGIRSEYDIIAPVLMTLQRDAAWDVRIAVSGAHLSDWHGDAQRAMERDGLRIADRIDSLFMTHRPAQRAKGVGVLIAGLTQTVEREQPDILLVVGDREEAIATAIVGNYLDVLVVHIGGGDTVFGNADDPVRFATSKLAHVHLTISAQSAERLRRVGEESFRIFPVGNPALDRIRSTPVRSREEVTAALGFDVRDGAYAVLLQHPLSSERDTAGAQIAVTLTALADMYAQSGMKVIAIAPNTDPGAEAIAAALTAAAQQPYLHVVRNLEREWFVNVMRHARVLVGNSSMGILEAPYYHLPVVNVGHRQQGREQAGNVEFVPHDRDAIVAALSRACMDTAYRQRIATLPNPFGDGHAAERIRDVLRTINPRDARWQVKRTLAGDVVEQQTQRA